MGSECGCCCCSCCGVWCGTNSFETAAEGRRILCLFIFGPSTLFSFCGCCLFLFEKPRRGCTAIF
ncbi:hypothetical protein, unlikely [Trypanosoma brucei brucei TREU927]|uniref:Uncharacterized protein n=3 Tax=Trypanosoma brucei TaxID=5691 RepID=Q38FK7_TRYB2|nr:hypothetical protein, unlikely [Trypanosoma brucei brucei TREU927]EAN76413.1 hypothetical protein, unlikely [Trypanosoma brucei brucei TREU927]RHW70417.1 hypothetical protein DPX39_090009800 [Trypanosoma brucei equiperdum]